MFNAEFKYDISAKLVHVVQGQLVENPLKDTRIGRKKKEAIKLLAKMT